MDPATGIAGVRSPSPRLRGRSRFRLRGAPPSPLRYDAIAPKPEAKAEKRPLRRDGGGAAKARPSPTRLGEASGAAWVGWERENRPPSVGVSNRFGSSERRGCLFPLPSDGRVRVRVVLFEIRLLSGTCFCTN